MLLIKATLFLILLEMAFNIKIQPFVLTPTLNINWAIVEAFTGNA